MTRSSRIQVSKIAVYWAVLTFALALFWSVALNMMRMSGLGPAVSLIIPAALAGGLASYFYFFRVHQTLEYDSNGYSIRKGRRKEEQKHAWSEFKETSIIRDNYGRTKVRVYAQRDGEHFDIDSKACGVDPFALRDYILERTNAKATDTSQDLFAGFEKEIQRGRAYWIADLNETFRSYQVSGEFFALMARGSTRPKGFLLSRFVAVTLMPNYGVALYANETGDSEGARTRVTRLIRVIETLRDEKAIKWSWLLLFSEEEPPSSITRFIEDFGNRDVGIGCINIRTGAIVTSKNQLGVSLAKQMRLNQLIRDLNKRHARSKTMAAG